MRYLFTYLFLLSVLFSSGQDSLVLSVTPKNIKIGEQAQLKLQYSYKADAGAINIIFPEFTDTIIDKIEIIEKGKLKKQPDSKSNDANRLIQEIEYTVTCFDSGYYAIPPVYAVINNDTVYSNPALLEVHTVNVDTTKNIKKIKDIYETSLSLGDYFRIVVDWLKDNILLIAIILVITALIIYFIYRKKKKPVTEEKPVIIIPAHIIAMEELQKLEQKKLWQEGHIKQYYIELTDILRSYIEQRFRIHAMEQTTEEIMSQLRLTDISEISKLTLVPVLKLSDLVKFAKENPIGTENEDMMQRAKDFVQSTIPPVTNLKDDSKK